jgi:hypothetical protein
MRPAMRGWPTRPNVCGQMAHCLLASRSSDRIAAHLGFRRWKCACGAAKTTPRGWTSPALLCHFPKNYCAIVSETLLA